MKILKKLQMIKPVLPAMLLGIFVIVAVIGYRPDAGTDSDGGSWVHKILAAGKQTTESQTVKAGKKVKVLLPTGSNFLTASGHAFFSCTKR